MIVFSSLIKDGNCLNTVNPLSPKFQVFSSLIKDGNTGNGLAEPDKTEFLAHL